VVPFQLNSKVASVYTFLKDARKVSIYSLTMCFVSSEETVEPEQAFVLGSTTSAGNRGREEKNYGDG